MLIYRQTVLLRTSVLLLLTLLASVQLRSADSLQSDPDFLPAFVLGEQGTITAILVDAEDRIYVGGSFDAGDGIVVRRNLMRLNPVGSIDPSFSPPPELESQVKALALAPDGKLYVGTDGGLFRLELNGASDVGFNAQLFGDSVETILIDGDGKIIVGGAVSAGFTGPEGVIRLDSTGAVDVAFNAGGSGASANVNALALQDDGKILIGGYFDQYNGTARSAVARLNTDGTLDATFDSGDSPGPNVEDIVVQPDGKILIGGGFDTFSNGTGRGLARLEADGTHDTSFVGFGSFGSGARDIHLLPDGRVLAVGGFIPDGEFTEDRVVRLTSTGAVDAVFETPAGDSFQPMRIAARPDGSFTVAGQADFTYETRNFFKATDALFTWGADDAPSEDFFARVGRGGCISAILPHPDGGILAAGQFHFVNGVPSGGVAHINADGSLNTEFSVGDNLADVPIWDAALQPDGKVLVAGGVFSFGTTPVNGVVRLLTDGSLDPEFTSETAAFNTIIWMELQADGKVLAASLGNAIFRLNTDGSIDDTFDIGTGPDRDTRSAVVQNDGKIVMVGEFENFNGTSISGIVRLNTDGSIDNTFAAGTGITQTGFSPLAQQIGIQPDGKLVVRGIFDGYNGTPVSRVIRINTDGSLDSGYDPWANTDDQPTGLYVQSDGKTLFTGNLTYNNLDFGNPNQPEGLIRIDSAGALDTSFGQAPFDEFGAWFETCTQTDPILATGGVIYISPYWEALSGFLSGGIIRLEASASDPLVGGTPVDDLPGWFFSGWFGYYNTDLAPWLFHAEHGFIYRDPGSTNESMFVYDDAMGAWWYTSEAIYPFLFAFDPPVDNSGTDIESAWLWYFGGTKGPRSFGVVTGASAGAFLFFDP